MHVEFRKYITEKIQGFPKDLGDQRTEKFKSFQEEDFNLLESDRALFDWASKQTYIPLANMLTAAAMLKVDSTPIEGFNQEELEKILVEEGVYDPEDFGIASMIAFGYTNRDHRPKTRREMNEVFEVMD